MKTNMESTSKRERLYRLGYLLFGIELPDQHQNNARHWLQRGLFRVACPSLWPVTMLSPALVSLTVASSRVGMLVGIMMMCSLSRGRCQANCG